MKTTVLLAGAVLAVAFCGCGIVPMLPGGEPFGEVTYSADRAETAYETFSNSFLQEQPGDWDGYSITLMEGMQTLYMYYTEEYMLFFGEDIDGADYLWYDGWLYQKDGDSVACREMDWDALQTGGTADRMWELLREMLGQTPAELSYKYVPMADDDRHLLKAEYELDEGQEGDFVKLSVPIHSDGSYDTVSISWEDVGEEIGVDNVVVSISFFAFQGSTDLQAERRIWRFGHDCGLTPEVVPALSQQEKEREWSREVIDSMDFAALREQAAPLILPSE